MQKAVNDNAKEAVDTLDYVASWVFSAWESTPIELKAFIMSVFVISILMQWVKKAMLSGMTKRRRVSLLWASSLPLGICIAIAGNILSGGIIHAGYWGVIGLTSGITAMGVHFSTVKVIWPAICDFFSRSSEAYAAFTKKSDQ